MRIRTVWMLAVGAGLAAAAAMHAQERGGGAEWLTARGDAQQTSWIRSDAAISAETMAGKGFELQWKTKLDNAPRQLSSLGQGVTANGVTLFVPMSLVTGSSNNVYSIDNETGYVVWQRHIDAPLPASATVACPGGITGAATRIVELVQPPVMPARAGGARGGTGYRSVIGEPGEGAPLGNPGAGRAAPPPAAAAPAGAPAAGAGAGAGAPPPPAGAPAAAPRAGAPAGAAPGRAGGGGGQGGARGNAGIPGAPMNLPGGGYARPAGVVYAIASDGQLHVLGLPSGKDIQKPAPFLPANARFSDLIAVGTTLYAATSQGCGGAPNGVWAIDLSSADTKPVTSWKTNGGSVVGAIAFGTDGTLFAAIGPGTVTGTGYANAIVALDPKTLALKNWFTQPNAEFVSAPLVFKHGDRDVVAAATKDGRILLLDGTAVGGANHTTTLYVSKPVTSTPASFAPGALAMWQELVPPGAAGGPMQPGQSWLLVPVVGPVPADMRGATTGAAPNGAVVALKITDAAGMITLEPGWTSRDLVAPVTPVIVGNVVFAVSSGRPAAPGGRGTPAVLHALHGTTGQALWTSGTTITSFMPDRSLWSATGQVYVGAFDGTVYAFGFAMERK